MNESDGQTIGLAMLYHRKHDGTLEKVLKTIEQLDYPKYKLHLIFADNMSRDGSR